MISGGRVVVEIRRSDGVVPFRKEGRKGGGGVRVV
jgi:hypothetical protein